MSANNPFNKNNKTPDKKSEEQARRVVENNSGNRAAIGQQRRSKPAPKPGTPRASIGGNSGASRGTTPSMPRNRPTTPKGGSGSATKRGCAGLTGTVLLLMFAAIFAIGKIK